MATPPLQTLPPHTPSRAGNRHSRCLNAPPLPPIGRAAHARRLPIGYAAVNGDGQVTAVTSVRELSREVGFSPFGFALRPHRYPLVVWGAEGGWRRAAHPPGTARHGTARCGGHPRGGQPPSRGGAFLGRGGQRASVLPRRPGEAPGGLSGFRQLDGVRFAFAQVS